MKNFDGRENGIKSIFSSFLEQFYSIKAQLFHRHIIRNGFWTENNGYFYLRKNFALMLKY